MTDLQTLFICSDYYTSSSIAIERKEIVPITLAPFGFIVTLVVF